LMGGAAGVFSSVDGPRDGGDMRARPAESSSMPVPKATLRCGVS